MRDGAHMATYCNPVRCNCGRRRRANSVYAAAEFPTLLDLCTALCFLHLMMRRGLRNDLAVYCIKARTCTAAQIKWRLTARSAGADLFVFFFQKVR